MSFLPCPGRRGAECSGARHHADACDALGEKRLKLFSRTLQGVRSRVGTTWRQGLYCATSWTITRTVYVKIGKKQRYYIAFAAMRCFFLARVSEGFSPNFSL